MCVTAAAAPFVMLAASAASTLFQMKATSDNARYAAQVQQNQAQMERESLALRDAERREKMRRVIGQQQAKFAAAGVGASGSPSSLLFDTADVVERESAYDAYRTEGTARKHESNADVYKSEARSKNVASIFDFGIKAAKAG